MSLAGSCSRSPELFLFSEYWPGNSRCGSYLCLCSQLHCIQCCILISNSRKKLRANKRSRNHPGSLDPPSHSLLPVTASLLWVNHETGGIVDHRYAERLCS